ncbi:MAG: hypothetical protein WD152_00805 [Nitriliruptoraceae bacterium]
MSPGTRGPYERRSTQAISRSVAGLAAAATLGSAMMALAHLGIDSTVLGFIGPGRLIVPAAIGFVVGTAAFAVVTIGAWHRRRWAWSIALVINGLAFATAVFPFRGWFSVAAATVAAAAITLLILPGGRLAFDR